MFIERMLNQGSAPVLERVLQFTGSRQTLLAEDIANLSTPGFKQKDLSLHAFQGQLRDRIDRKNSSVPGTVRFDDVPITTDDSHDNILFHDGSNRSVEQLMADSGKNGLMHTLAIELLKRQFQTMELSLKDKV
jgi:flagellar basal-body rod protein FlgB